MGIKIIRMSDLPGVKIPGIIDLEASNDVYDSVDNYVDIRVQQRNGRKCITSVQGLDKNFDKEKILKALKKEFCCNGCVVEDEKVGQVLQLQGDQRKNIQQFLAQDGIVKKELIKIHGPEEKLAFDQSNFLQ